MAVLVLFLQSYPDEPPAVPADGGGAAIAGAAVERVNAEAPKGEWR